MKRYRIGIIGLGARAETFARSLYAGSPRAELHSLCDLDDDRTRKFVDYCGLAGAKTYLDPAEFLAQPDLDAVMVTTPDFTHRDVALPLMRAGKHVYLEKPLDVTSEKCRDIIRAQRETGVTAFVGFNMRAVNVYEKLKQLLAQDAIGQVIHIQGLEQLSIPHSASFMRRFHRKIAGSGGFLNTKCSHDLDIIQWLIGHQHRIVKVASFGGLNVFLPKKQPATHCHKCPDDIYRACPYKDQAGFVFPVRGTQPIHHRNTAVYGGDLCVYNDDKELIDNQTVIMEWDNGVRGNFNLQLFQKSGRRQTTIWGEKGRLDMDGLIPMVKLTRSDTGEEIDYHLGKEAGGHGGSDPKMLARFLDAIEGKPGSESNLHHGLAATLLAEKARLAMEQGQVLPVTQAEYDA